MLQSLTALLPADELGARFCHWFNHGWGWIYAEAPAPGEKAQWFTENRYPLQPRNIWQEYLNPEKIIGLRFDNYETRYGLIDLDRGSSYHLANDRAQFKALLTTLEAIGLCRRRITRSSDSEGIHIYYFLPEVAPTFDLACAIRFALEDAGFQLRSGQLEIFPNTKAFSPDRATDYNGHRLPLQAGSYWIDEEGEIISNDLAQFLDAADSAAAGQDMPTLRKAIAAASKNRRRLRFSPDSSNKAAEWKRHLEERIAEGWTGYHQTNELLKDFATYGVVFLHLSGATLVDYVEATAKAAPGYEQYCRHQHEIRRRAKERARGADNGFYVPYRGFPKRSGRSYRENFQPQNNIVSLENQANASRRQEAAERIQQAMNRLEADNALPLGATARASAIVSVVKELSGKGISISTLHQPYHLPLWHPGHQESPEPAQGGLFRAVSETIPHSESPEPAQGGLFRATPLYEGGGADGGQPHAHSVQGTPPIPPLEIFSPPLLPSQDDCCSSRRDPSTDDWHTDCHNPADQELGIGSQESGDDCLAPAAPVTPPAAPATPAVSAVSEGQEAAPTTSAMPQPISTVPAAPAASKIPMPDDASPETIRRLTRIHLEAGRHARKAVEMQQLAARCKFDPTERNRREVIARMEYLWRSGEPLWMEEVKHWAARNPGSLPDIPLPDSSS